MGDTSGRAVQNVLAIAEAADRLDVARLNRRSRAFQRRVVELAPGERLDHDDGFWWDAIVFVTAGTLEVKCAEGQRHRFDDGDILTLARLPIRSACNSGTTPLRLVAIRRTPSAPVGSTPTAAARPIPGSMHEH